ncbi:FKBP12-associated protein, partial [Cryomyces antarcticus]
MRCAASRTSEGNNSKSLPCNDECTALARKRQIALALSINPETHVDGGDHIPYASETLSLYQRENAQWAQTQEKEFRIFALDTEAKRLRFKPMPPSQRAFLHALADDYGLDSESMDPEPHRHVAVFKTPRFVAAPNKTLSECVRIRQLQRASAAPADDALPQQQRKRAGNEFGEPYNAFLITNPRFGLTVDEIRAELATVTTITDFAIEFLPSEEVVLKPSSTLASHALATHLSALKPSLATALAAKGLGTLQLAAADASLNILRREADDAADARDGWSRVAAKAAAPRRVVQYGSGVGSTNGFAALTGQKVTFARKKAVEKEKGGAKGEGKGGTKAGMGAKREESVVEDWEAAEAAEEERERG